MKALTLSQPWASLVAIGAKRIETRSWGTNYRGPLAIHAAKNFSDIARQLCYTEPFASALIDVEGVLYSNSDELPTGVVVAVVELTDVLPIYATDESIPAGTRGVSLEHDQGPATVWVWRPTELAGQKLYMGESGWSPKKENGWAGEHEAAFGDYRSGRRAWLFDDVRAVDPVPARGRQGLWTLEVEIANA